MPQTSLFLSHTHSLSRVVALKNSSNMWRKMKERIRAKEIKKKEKKRSRGGKR